jgi:hypothetical protein
MKNYRDINFEATYCRHDFMQVATTQFVGWCINDPFVIQAVQSWIIFGTKPAQRLILQAKQRGHQCGTYSTSSFGKTAHPSIGMHGMETLFLHDFPRALA